MIPTSRPHTPAAEVTQTPRQADLAPESLGEQDGLSVQEMLALICAYRGGAKGLEGLSKRDLTVLLEYHRASYVPHALDIR